MMKSYSRVLCWTFCSFLLTWGARTYAQPGDVNSIAIRLVEFDPNTLQIEVRPNATWTQADGIVNMTFAIRWDSDAGGTLGNPSQLSFADLCMLQGIPLQANPGIDNVDNEGFRYRGYNANGSGFPVECSFAADTWVPFARIPVSGLTGCTTFEIVVSDAFTSQLLVNSDWFVSIGGTNITSNSPVVGPGVQLGDCDMDCEGVVGGPAGPGTPCDDGDACTTNDLYNANCDCVGTPVAAPSISSTTSNSPICADETLTLGVTATTSTGSLGYSWTGTGTFSPNATSANVSVTGAATGNYVVTVSNGCATAEATVPVTVDPVPAAPSTGSYGPACTDAADITLGGTPGGGVWTGTGVSGSGPYTFDPSVGTQTLTYTVTSNGCSNSATTQIVVGICDCAGVVNGTAFIDPCGDCVGGTTGAEPCAFDCPQLEANIGDACDDENASTENDVVNENCECVGTPIVTFDCPDLQANIGDACDDENASTENDTVTANCECVGTPIVTFDCPELQANIGDACDDENASTENDTVNDNCECVGTPIVTFDCPELQANIGDACDDENASTENDTVNENCECVGTPIVTFDCPDLQANIGDACDDENASTENDTVNDNCECVGTPIGDCELVTLELQTDANGSQTSWEIISQGSMEMMCEGEGYPDNSIVTESCCLPEGCYILRVYDSAGDGMASGTNGGYVLRTTAASERIIDNRNNFLSGNVSAIANDQGFCLPIGDDHVIFTSCDKLDWLSGEFIVASLDPAVSAEWIENAPNSQQDANSGYEFWFFDPNGSYSFRWFRAHNTSHGYGSGPARAAHLRINNWLAAYHIPENVLMNVRVRARVNGVNTEWGPACRFKIDPVLAACPATKLMDIPGNQYLSCGESRGFGVSQYASARPVSGATQYQFRFRQPAENFEVVRTSNTWHVQLWWGAPLPILEAGEQYEVDVRAFKGGQWCPWGEVCTLNIVGEMQGNLSERIAMEDHDQAEGRLNMWPNPNNGDQLYLMLDAIPGNVSTIGIDVFDMFGKRSMSSTLPIQDGNLNTVISLGDEMSSGLYIMNITVGEKVITERLMIQR